MKSLAALLLLTFLTISLFSQSPDLMTYQMVVRDNAGNIVAGSNVGLRLSILQGSAAGAEVFAETHSDATNTNGLLSVLIGNGINVSGSIAAINWAAGPFFLRAQTDPTGGTNYSIENISQLVSVPYSYFSSEAQSAQSAGNGFSHVSETGDMLYFLNGGYVIIPGISAANGGGNNDVPGCTNATACNYNSSATQDDGSCYYVGSPCNDGNNNTFNDVYNTSCNCEGSTGGTGPLNITTALIPAGTFTMGSPTTEPGRYTDEVQHTVTLSAFRMSVYEITNAQYATFLNANGIGANGQYAAGAYPDQTLIYDCGTYNGLSYNGAQWQPAAGEENFPVVCVTWYGAAEYATYAGGRLPTEAEWEYACRGGTTTPFNTGNCLDYTQANYWWQYPYIGCSNANTIDPEQTQAVDTYAPNAYGLYNMHGNVWEWCSDWYGAYGTAAQSNPTGPSSGWDRVLRGGSWCDFAQGCRSAFRDYFIPGNGSYGYLFGFRLAFLP